MYNPPRPKKEEFSLGRISLKKARNFTYSAAVMACMTVGAAFFMTLRTLQDRDREATKATTRARRDGQRVVVIGAGAGGAALAGFLTATAPQVQVTVIEKERKQVFRGLEAHAHVGHRSYDLNTTGGYDSLRSPASWNVTRDANLVMGQVVRVDTAAKAVLVKPANATNTTTGSHRAKDAAKNAQGAATDSASSATSASAKPKQNWFQANVPFHVFSSTAVTPEKDDAITVRADGLVAYPYDVLVLASGAERGVTGPLTEIFPPEHLDRYTVAVNPGVARDNLGQLYEGNVLHIKVPPARLFQLYETQRQQRARQPGHVLNLFGCKRRGGTLEAPVCVPGVDMLEQLEPLAHSTAPKDVQTRQSAREAAWMLAHLGTVNPKAGAWTDALLPPTPRPTPPTQCREIAPPYCRLPYPSLVSRDDAFAVSGLSFFADCHAARQLDSVFVSTTNLLWKYMAYFNKFGRCQLVSISADAEPLGPAAPPVVNSVVRTLWASRQQQQREAAAAAALSSHATATTQAGEDVVNDGLAQRFHVLANTYVTGVDYTKREAVLYNHREDLYLKLPYRLLVLDLPLIAPSFIAASGLDRATAAAAKSQSHRWGRGLFRWGSSSSSSSSQGTGDKTVVAASDASLSAAVDAPHAAAFATLDSRVAAAPRGAAGVDEDTFPDIDPRTLQHQRFPDIFALGDVAGVPSIKSYGATFTQVPVVAHNVTQVLFNQKRESQARVEASSLPLQDTKKAPEHTAVAKPVPRREINGRYDGYTSFHIMMTPWRALWPECVYSDALKAVLDSPTTTSTTPAAAAATSTLSSDAKQASAYLQHVDHHMYNNLSWRGVGGFLNGFFIQSSAYENAYFFLFTRGIWYPPRWFRTVSFNAEDGSEKSQGFL